MVSLYPVSGWDAWFKVAVIVRALRIKHCNTLKCGFSCGSCTCIIAAKQEHMQNASQLQTAVKQSIDLKLNSIVLPWNPHVLVVHHDAKTKRVKNGLLTKPVVTCLVIINIVLYESCIVPLFNRCTELWAIWANGPTPSQFVGTSHWLATVLFHHVSSTQWPEFSDWTEFTPFS